MHNDIGLLQMFIFLKISRTKYGKKPSMYCSSVLSIIAGTGSMEPVTVLSELFVVKIALCTGPLSNTLEGKGQK